MKLFYILIIYIFFGNFLHASVELNDEDKEWINNNPIVKVTADKEHIEKTDYALIRNVSIIFILTILIFFIWTTKLKKEITRRKDAEKRYLNLYNHSIDMQLSIDVKTQAIIECNQTICEALNYSKDELIGKNVFELYHPDCVQSAKKEFTRFLKAGKSINKERVFKTKDGIDIDVLLNIIATYDENNNMAIGMISLSDISESKKSQRLVKATNDKLIGLYELSPLGILLTDMNGLFVEFNDSFVNICGYPVDELKSLDYWGLTPKKYIDDEAAQLKSLEETGFYGPYEKEYYHKDGHLVPINLNGMIVTGSDGKNYIWSIIEDITYRKNNEKKLEEKQMIMIQQARLASMGEMIGNISHQWRQPLNGLGLLTQKLNILYQRGLLNEDSLNANVLKSMNIINSMSSTIDDFRDFFNPNKEKEHFLISKAIEKSYAIVEGLFTSNNIEFEVEIEEENLGINGYFNEFSQVMINLFNNSKDALLENKVSNAYTRVNVSQEDSHVLIKVFDNGGGIKKSKIDKIFEPYFTTKEEGKGTGIGLYMSKNIIEEHMNGVLTVENSKEGACFSIRLPIQ